MTTRVECTPPEASWCPVHGDCTCDREQGLDEPSCPLHGRDTQHGSEPHYEDRVTCPACGHVDVELSDYPASLRGDGDTAAWICDACGCHMEVFMRVAYSFKAVAVAAPQQPGSTNPQGDSKP